MTGSTVRAGSPLLTKHFGLGGCWPCGRPLSRRGSQDVSVEQGFEWKTIAFLLVAIVAGAFAFVYRDPMERGLRLGARYGSEIEALRTAAKPEIFQQIERVTPKDAVLLFVNTNRGFFSPREYLADSFFQASQIADWLRPVQSVAELRALLDARGVTHVLFEKRDWGIRYPRALRELLTRREQTRRVAVSADRRTELYELLPPGQGVESRVTLPAGANFYSM